MKFSFFPITALQAGMPGNAGDQVLAIADAALLAVDPAEAVRRNVCLQGETLLMGTAAYRLDTIERVFVVGAGKASAAMAVALEEILGDRITSGWINVKDGYTAPTRRITIHECGHPVPDQRGVDGTAEIARILRECGPHDLVLCLLSGGGSALMVLPAKGLSLADLERTTSALLRSGATINEMNAVRKHLSQIKGGQLSRLAAPAQVAALIVSDVIGNPLDVIASGPTTPDPTTFADAYGLLQRLSLLDQVPPAVVEHLQRGMDGLIPETPKANDAAFSQTRNLLIASNEVAVRAAIAEAERLGFHTLFLSTFIQGEAREVGKVLAGILQEIDHSGHPLPRPACVIAGGETTVTVRGQGKGGRNQELALGAVPYLAGLEDVALLALGTDGTDGPTDAAGAIVTGDTARRAAALSLSPSEFLAANDSYRFFAALGDLVITGPTNTNVNDIAFLFAF